MPHAEGLLARGWKSISFFAFREFCVEEEVILFVVLGRVKEKIEDKAGEVALVFCSCLGHVPLAPQWPLLSTFVFCSDKH